MELADIGFDAWFQQKREQSQMPDGNVARIARVDRNRYLVRNETEEIPAESVGRLLYHIDSSQGLPCVGDWVFVQYGNNRSRAVICDLFPRKSFLRRKTAGIEVDYQMIASNVDVVFIMQSCDLNFNLRRLERYIVMANEGQVEPVILLSKSDLVDSEDIERKILEIGCTCTGVKTIAFSNETADGIDAVRRILEKGKTYCLLGSSGVGKTSLLNNLLGTDTFETTPVREKDGRGRHTTSSRQLTLLDNGALLIDTPGMREIGMIADVDSIDDSFSDIVKLSTECRFNDCAHTVEIGCAILDAVQQGLLDEGRYQSYIKLGKESAFSQMSYVERRRKDRQFGRMVKTAASYKKKPPL